MGSADREDMIRVDDKAFYWKNVYLCSNSVFDIFTHDIIFGDPKTALTDPDTAAVSETFAKKYFGDANPIGKTFSNESGTFAIKLVFADLPENSHLKYDVLLSNAKFLLPDNEVIRRGALWNVGMFTYLLMPENYDPDEFDSISRDFYERHMSEFGEEHNSSWHSWLQPLTDVHFKSKVGYDLPTGNIAYVYGFAAVGIFILLVACINYMNLATARATRRAKEVGMRKVLGVGRRQLILQFLGESIFFSLIALFLGLALAEFILHLTPINNLLGNNIDLNLTREPLLIVWFIAFGIVVGLISGSYPALYLSAILPLPALVTGLRAGKRSVRFRQLLVLIQFFITVTVIAATLIMALQMRYMSNKSLGFNKENRVILKLLGADVYEKLPTIRKELLKNDHVLGMAVSPFKIGADTPITVTKVSNNNGVLEETTLKWVQVGDDYVDVMGMQLSQGRDFSKKLLTDVGTSFVVNEALVKKMGWDEAIGKQIQLGINDGRVVGVVKDFHFLSLHNPIEPFAMFRLDIDTSQIPVEGRAALQVYLMLNISGENIPQTLGFLEDKFAEFDPKHPFQFEFLDDYLTSLYLSDQRLMKLTGVFACVCILISCMGLFGMASFTTEQRTKEIGIRKVLGATTWQIIFLLFKNILFLVLVGAVAASLVAYFAMDEWLTGFAYRTGIEFWVFLLSTATAAFVAFVTVAMQSYKTAQANPVNALRYE
jgi:putative ABC transport system permease protein